MFKRAAEAVGLHYRLIAKPSFEEAVAAIRQVKPRCSWRPSEPGRERYAIFVGPYYSSLRPSSAASAMGGHP
jgi:hypothetical protein